jgi:D-alanine-D-alanine ligase
MQVTVLYGGPSAEREVSLVSGAAVIEALKSMGYDVFASDISPADLSGLDHPAEVVFPVLHGQFGESGELQEILETRRIRFVGSGSRASRIGIDKLASKRAWDAAGLPTPPCQLITTQDYNPAAGPDRIGTPCVVKAVDSGSSIDVYICKTADEAKRACAKVLENHGRALVEKFIDGIEMTVAIFEEQALSPIRISTTREFYDFEAKYKGNYTTYDFELGIDEATTRKVKNLAQAAHQTIGCRDLSRVDVMLDKSFQPYLLEINTIPGFTSKSLLPKAAAHCGIAFGPLVDRLARRAAARSLEAAA